MTTVRTTSRSGNYKAKPPASRASTLLRSAAASLRSRKHRCHRGRHAASPEYISISLSLVGYEISKICKVKPTDRPQHLVKQLNRGPMTDADMDALIGCVRFFKPHDPKALDSIPDHMLPATMLSKGSLKGWCEQWDPSMPVEVFFDTPLDPACINLIVEGWPLSKRYVSSKVARNLEVPYCTSFDGQEFEYLRRPAKGQVYIVSLKATDEQICIKYVHGHYGADAHRAAAAAGYAPALRTTKDLGFGWTLVVMDAFMQDYRFPERSYRELISLRPEDRTPEMQTAVRQAVSSFHELGFVHGDLRAQNIMVPLEGLASDMKIQIVDWDWAGKEGMVIYPLYMWICDMELRASESDVWRPHSIAEGDHIRRTHDEQMLKYMFEIPKPDRYIHPPFPPNR